MLLILSIRGRSFDSPSIALLRQYETEKFSLRVSAGARKVISHCGAAVCFTRSVRIGEERIHCKIGDPLVLHVFLDHYALQSNYATSKTGAPLDFVSFHAKGTPSVENGHVQMGIRNQLAAIQRGFEIVTSFPSGGTLRSSWENPIQKAALPARPRNILKALTEMARCSQLIRRS